MDELSVVRVVPNQTEAEILCGLLRQAGITCMYRVTNHGAGAADGLAVGVPQEVIVRTEDVASANEVLGD
jgi:Putative prokaryotic signal transducing protein